jgi:hypothetical protein
VRLRLPPPLFEKRGIKTLKKRIKALKGINLPTPLYALNIPFFNEQKGKRRCYDF